MDFGYADENCSLLVNYYVCAYEFVDILHA